MLENFRKTKCYQFCGMATFLYCLAMVYLFIHARFFAHGWDALGDLVLMLLLTLILAFVFIILTGIAIYQTKKSKGLNERTSIIADIGYVISCVIISFLLCGFTIISIGSQANKNRNKIIRREFPSVRENLYKALRNITEERDFTCGDSQENFAKCLSKQLVDVENVDGNTIYTKDRIYKIIIKSNSCDYKNIKDCSITIENKNSNSKVGYLEMYFSTRIDNYFNRRNYVLYYPAKIVKPKGSGRK